MTNTLRKILFMLLGLTAGLLVWAAAEVQLFTDGGGFYWRLVLLGASMGALFGGIIGTGEGVALSIAQKTLRGLLFGILLGIAGGIVSILCAQGLVLFFINREGASPVDISSRYLPLGRFIGWVVLGLVLGGIEGLRSVSLRRTLFGLAGGVLGGLIGGAIFELSGRSDLSSSIQRLLGFGILGICIGAGISLTESWGRFGTIKVLNGPFKGKEFIISKGRSLIGASPAAEITLPGDAKIQAKHGRIVKDREGLRLEKIGKSGSLTVNDRPETSCRLKFEDVIRLGETSLRLNP